MDVFQHKKHWQCTQGYLCSFRKYRLDIHFRIHEIDSNLQCAASVTEFVAYSALFLMSIMANTLAAKKQFDTRKWWV